jgi:predicted transcriptional regulator
MKNVTVTLPDEVARQMRILAAEADTSMSQFLGRLIAEKLQADRDYRSAQCRFLGRAARVLDASTGTRPTRDSLHDRAALR